MIFPEIGPSPSETAYTSGFVGFAEGLIAEDNPFDSRFEPGPRQNWYSGFEDAQWDED